MSLRPIENLRLVSHEKELKQFLDIFHSKRCPHGWIISGPKGIGKTTFAYHLARYILSKRENGNTSFSPDDPLVHRMIAGTHGDLFVVTLDMPEEEKGSSHEISVETIRKLNHFLNQTSHEGGWRVVLIDGADAMNRNAANALLKKLEEPPAKTVFFLTTSFPGLLLPTIRSRCQKLSLRALSADHMLEVISLSGVSIKSDLTQELLWIAKGSPGKFMALLALEEEEKLYSQLKVAVMEIPTKGLTKALALAKKCTTHPDKFLLVEEILLSWIHRITELTASQTPERIPIEWQNMAALCPLDEWLHIWEKVQYLFQQGRLFQLDSNATLFCVFSILEKRNANL